MWGERETETQQEQENGLGWLDVEKGVRNRKGKRKRVASRLGWLDRRTLAMAREREREKADSTIDEVWIKVIIYLSN